jgi:hypothetical protein
MDNTHFDALARGLSTGQSRRRLLAYLGTLPVMGGLAAILDPADAEGAGRRKRRKKRHKHGKGRRRQGNGKKKRCKAASVAATCAGKCGSVTNTCKKVVDCGPCTCDPPCGACERCSGTTCAACALCCDAVCCDQADAICHRATGACCVPESAAQTCDGKCGTVANTCGVEVDCGPCRCDPACAVCQICDEQTGQCVEDPAQAGTCCDGTAGVCSGGVCTLCDTYPNSVCDPATGACECTATCTGKACGADDGCGGICVPGTCPQDHTCQPDGTCLQNLNEFQCLCGDDTTPAECVRNQCRPAFDTVCSRLCSGHSGYYGLGTSGTGCGPGSCTT